MSLKYEPANTGTSRTPRRRSSRTTSSTSSSLDRLRTLSLALSLPLSHSLAFSLVLALSLSLSPSLSLALSLSLSLPLSPSLSLSLPSSPAPPLSPCLSLEVQPDHLKFLKFASDPSGFNLAQHSPTIRPSVERTAEKAFCFRMAFSWKGSTAVPPSAERESSLLTTYWSESTFSSR